MPEPNDSRRRSHHDGNDCPLPVERQNRNIALYALYWGIAYLSAPVSYIGLTHANLLKELGNTDTVCNRPSSAYLWMSVVPVVMAWLLPEPRHIKPLALSAIGAMAAATVGVAVTLASDASATVTTWLVIAHGAVYGGANGIILTSLWDMLRRGVSTSRRGRALGAAFGIGPLFACVGALLQDALFQGQLLGGWSFGLNFPFNYLAMFAAVAPLLLVKGAVIALFTLPDAAGSQPSTTSTSPPDALQEIKSGLRQFVGNRAVLYAVLIYVIVYSGGNAIFANVSLHAKDVLGRETDTLGVQSFLRFGFKAVAGAGLGWLLATASPRATLVTTTSILLIGMGWALGSSGQWFLLTIGVMGAGELFGAYFPNYVTTASEKSFVRLNMAYLSLLSVLIGFSPVAFGKISDLYGRKASFGVAAGMLVIALVLIGLLLPADPTPHEHSAADTPPDRKPDKT
jgi:MFS family permease